MLKTKIVDRRNKVKALQLQDLHPNETFEWVTENDELDHAQPYRMLWQNSNYLSARSSESVRMFVLNMVTGKIHHRDRYASVCRINVSISIF